MNYYEINNWLLIIYYEHTCHPQVEVAERRHLEFRSRKCPCDWVLSHRCFKVCRSSLLRAWEQRRISWTSSDKLSRSWLSQGPETWQPSRFRSVSGRRASLTDARMLWSPADVTDGFPDRFRLTSVGHDERHLAKVATLLSVSPFAARLRWVREHSSCDRTLARCSSAG